jgi:plasmid stabilization system protein ParE
MKRTVRFLPEALEDLLETRHWYARREADLGLAFAEAIATAIVRIEHDPASFPRVDGEVRRLVVRQFPYAVYFREEGDELLVLAVHGRQDPRRWQERSGSVQQGDDG